MQLRHLECFLAVAEELHFTRAARRLRLSQPPLSRHIKELEAQLGVILFERTRRSVALTPAGQAYAKRVRFLLNQLEEARDEARRIQRGEAGTLTIGFVGALEYEFLPSLLRGFRARRPEVHLKLYDLVPSEQLEALGAERIDLGFVGLLPADCGSQTGHQVVRRERMVVALPAGCATAKRKTVALQSLANEPWVLIERKVAPAYRHLIHSSCGKAGFAPRVEQETARAQAMLGLVAAGLGVTIVPETVARLRPPGVAFRPLREALVFEHVVVWNAAAASPLREAFLQELSGVV